MDYPHTGICTPHTTEDRRTIWTQDLGLIPLSVTGTQCGCPSGR